MAYKKQSDPELVNDIHKRKEFAQLWVPPPNIDGDGDDFRGTMSSADMQTHQQFVRNFMNPNTPNMRMHLMHSTGCHAPGTLIKMANGTARPVEQICIGDQLVHPNGHDVMVTELHHGFSQMMRIVPRGGGAYIVNIDHILRIYDCSGEPLDISVRDYWASVPMAPVIMAPMEPDIEIIDWFLYYVGKDGAVTARPFTIEAYGSTPEALTSGEYFGFTVSSPDGLFLGADGLILHNSGKTRAAISAAQECIKLYRYIYRDVNWRDVSAIGPSIFVIAFGGKQAFFWDLIKYSEFGYVSTAEYDELMRLYLESVENDEAYKKYIDLWSNFKRRATSRSKGGFYRMYGYDEFVNRLFGGDAPKLNDVIQRAHSFHEPYHTALEKAISKGEIKIDTNMLARLENSMIICDEIHNTYNTQTINNRGLAIQYVLDHVKGLRFLSLSATPINGVPSEIADFINYFVESERKVMRESLFSGHNLLPGAIDKIDSLLQGHVSFLYDFDPRYFPKRIDRGIALSVGDRELPYLRFTPCVMSDFFTATIRAFYETPKDADSTKSEALQAPVADDPSSAAARDVDVDDEIVGIPQNAYSLFDFVFPNPDAAAHTGLYNSSTLFGTIHSAPNAWKHEVGIATKVMGGLHTFNGSFLALGNIEKYSAKYAQMVKTIFQIIRENGPCKIMVYHERVRITGVLLIREILRENGVLDEHDEATNGTVCAICAKPRNEHRSAGAAMAAASESHEFRPLRLATIYSELDKTVINSIRERYNSVANVHGEWCSILLGSRIIRESYDFNAVRFLIVLSLPVSISQLIQVFGRCVRRMSHLRLPEAERNVNVYILVNVASERSGSVLDVSNSPEVRRYAIKLQSYLTVQKIEREMARNAVDAGINKNIITRPEKDSLGFLLYNEATPFDPTILTSGDLHTDTFFAYGYGMQEVQFTIGIIKRLFGRQHIWNGHDLVVAIRSPPFGVWSNPALISDSSIVIALSFLMTSSGNMVGMGERAIMIGDTPHIIVATSMATTATRAMSASQDEELDIEKIITSEDYLFLAPIETIEVAGIFKSRPLVDVESFIRGTRHETEDVIPIDQFELQTSFEESILTVLREEYKPKLIGEKITTGMLVGMRSFLVKFSSDQQRIVAQHLIESVKLRNEFPVLTRFMHALGIFIPYSYVSKYRHVAQRLNAEYTARLGPGDPIAFGNGLHIELYTGIEWISIGRSALNMHIEYDENDVIVGIYKQFPYEIKFQLRDPIQKLRAMGKHKDARTIERGSVCVTKSRKDTEKYAQRLGLTVATIREANTVHSLCDVIQVELLKKEIKERADSHSLVKFVYGWWNTLPSPF